MTTSAPYTVDLLENRVEDPNARENFSRIKIFLRDKPILKAGFVFKEIQADTAGVYLKFKHNLKFIPKDVLMTSVIPSASVVNWAYESFDDTFVTFSVTVAPCTIRAFFGTYQDGVV